MAELIWCVRWETTDSPAVGSYGALIEQTHASRTEAHRERDRLAREVPERPFHGSDGAARPVRYVVFSRPVDDAFLHDPEWERPWSENDDD